jgi:uncharacterized LabA/DUF88 family protein
MKQLNQKPYKEEKFIKNNMSPGDSKESPDESFIFIDAGFLSKLSKYLGNGKYLRYHLINFAERLCLKQKLDCTKIYYYTAPPFQSNMPTKNEELRKKNYDRFIKKIVLIACDSDFVPVVKRLEEHGIKTILYTYYQKSRDENFSTSNQLVKSVWKYTILTKDDFDKAPLT